MKKIIVISDSHGNKALIDRVFNELKFDYLIHLGDGIEDFGSYIYDERVKVVRGNCDFFSNEKTESFLVVENVIIFYTHGHEYGVKHTLNQLYKRIMSTSTSLVLYGHTHIPKTDSMNNITFHNPGSLSRSRLGSPSYSIITIDGKNFSIQKYSF